MSGHAAGIQNSVDISIWNGYWSSSQDPYDQRIEMTNDILALPKLPINPSGVDRPPSLTPVPMPPHATAYLTASTAPPSSTGSGSPSNVGFSS